MLALAQQLSIPPYAAVGLMESTWHFTARYAPTGNIGRWSDEVIARGVTWDRDPAELVKALVDCRWLDTCARHRLVVHDWSQHSDDALHRALARAGMLFADGNIPNTSRLAPGEKEKAEWELKKAKTGARRAHVGRTVGAPPRLIPAPPEPEPKDAPHRPPAGGLVDFPYPPEFERVWAKKPRRAGANPKFPAFEAWRARQKEGASVEDLESAVERYARFCEATGKIGQEGVQQLATFFGPKKAGWRETWEPPTQPPSKPNGFNQRRVYRSPSGRKFELAPGQKVAWADPAKVERGWIEGFIAGREIHLLAGGHFEESP